MGKSKSNPQPVSVNPWSSNEKTAVNLGVLPAASTDKQESRLDEDKKWMDEKPHKHKSPEKE